MTDEVDGVWLEAEFGEHLFRGFGDLDTCGSDGGTGVGFGVGLLEVLDGFDEFLETVFL
jgi:hypothetical protein